MLAKIVFSAFLVPLASCTPLNRGFEFLGEYEAVQSRYRIEVKAAGNIKGGHDISDRAFSIVRICPRGGATGKQFDVALAAASEGSIVANCRDLNIGPSEWNWKTSVGILRGMLDRAGFQDVDEAEIKGSVRVIEGSLAGPKGSVLNGQIDSLKVLRAESKYSALSKKGEPELLWLGNVSLLPCEEGGAQPAAAPDATRR